MSTSPPTSSPTQTIQIPAQRSHDAPPNKPGKPRTENYSDRTRGLLELLNKLPPKPQITFRGYVDRTVDRVRVVGSHASHR